MNILLINPSQKKVYGEKVSPPYPPLGLLMIGSVLKEMSQNVKLIDIDVQNYDDTKLIYELKNFKPDLVGLTCVTPTFNSACHIAKIVKNNSSAAIVLGGVHPTTVPDECLKKTEIDFLVAGEGEITIKELVEFLQNNRKDFEKIKGLYFRRGQEIIKGSARPLIKNLDNLPFPAWELIENLYNYQQPDAVYQPVISLMTTRGCPFSCIFCSSRQVFGQIYRSRSKESLISEIKYYIEEFKIKELHIMDDAFALDKSRTIELCRAIKENNFNLILSFANGLRADSVDEEVLLALKNAGFRDLGFGVETGDEKILKLIKKNTTKDVIRRAFNLAKKIGFNTWGFFMIGLPGETKETIRKTINFAKELNPDFAKFLIFKPFPGTEIFKSLKENNAIIDFNYDHYGVYTPPVHQFPSLSAKKMLDWQRRAYWEFYLRPKKLFGYLLRLKSPAQLKSNFMSIKFLIKLLIGQTK